MPTEVVGGLIGKGGKSGFCGFRGSGFRVLKGGNGGREKGNHWFLLFAAGAFYKKNTLTGREDSLGFRV